MTTKSRTTPPKQEFQEEPNPELQAALTDPDEDRAERHEPEEPADAAEERSAEAPGIRTEPEIVADHQEANERAAAAAAAGHTADPAASTSAAKMPRVENRDRLVHFRRKSTGDVQSVNEGTPEHGILIGDPDFEETSKPSAADRRKQNEALGRFSSERAEARAERRQLLEGLR